MNRIRFLFDEQLSPALIAAVLQREPAIDAHRVGWPGMPPRGTPDPDLLLAAEGLGRLLVSLDKKTMPGHVADHLAAGHHTWGVLLLRSGYSWSAYVDELVLIWSASEAEEWIDRLEYIPW